MEVLRNAIMKAINPAERRRRRSREAGRFNTVKVRDASGIPFIIEGLLYSVARYEFDESSGEIIGYYVTTMNDEKCLIEKLIPRANIDEEKSWV